MLIQLLLVVFIIGLLISGPSFGNVWLTSAFYGGMFVLVALAFWYSRRLSVCWFGTSNTPATSH